MITIDESIKDTSTLSLKQLGNAMVDRLEATKKHVNKNSDYDILDYIIIKGKDESFKPNIEALGEVEDQDAAVTLAVIVGGMCEMSEIIVKLSNEVTRRKK